MALSPLILDAHGVNALLVRAFPDRTPQGMARVVELEPGRARVVQVYEAGMLRPGPVISGPTQMSLADMAAYALVLGHLGDVLMAVTSTLTMNFLRAAPPADLWAEAQMLRLGRRNAVMDVRLWSESPQRICAQAVVTYAIPQAGST